MTDNPLAVLIGIVLLAYALMTALLVRDPFGIRTPLWLKVGLIGVIYVGGSFVIGVFILGAIVCHGTC